MKKTIYLILIYIFTTIFSYANDRNLNDYFHIGKMVSYDDNFILYFKTREKSIIAKGENSNYINDYPQDLYIYNNLLSEDKPLISYEWFPSRARKLLNKYNFPVFPEDFAYYLLRDNNTLNMVSALKNVNESLMFDIKKNELKVYNNNGKLDFIISSFAKSCGFSDLNTNYKCNLYKPLISNNLIN